VQTDLAGRGALITGSVGGLGLAIAISLARCGCRVMLHGIASEGEAAPALERVREAGAEVFYCRADLSGGYQAATALAETAQAQLGTVDILVNNAVTRHFAPLEEMPPQSWEKALSVNVSAPFYLVQTLLPGMRARGWGRVVNMVSVYGQRGVSNRSDYVTSKAALLGLTRAIAAETAGTGVTSNAVCPGSVSTPGTEERVAALMAGGLSREEAVRSFLVGKQPSGRFVEAEGVAAAVLFLCSEGARDITSSVLPVDGGWLGI